MPNVHPSDGRRHASEPDRSLRAHRDVDAGAPGKGCLGMQLCPLFDQAGGGGEVAKENLEGWIGVGMTVEVEATGEHVYVKQ